MFGNPFVRDCCTCWICLEQSRFDKTWIYHDCGCNLQVHKLCYLRWLYNINKNQISRNLVSKDLQLVTEDNLKRALCFSVDGHRNLQREISIPEFLKTLPIFGAKSKETMNSVSIINILGINYSISFRLLRIPMELPVEFAECPQCKKHIINEQVTFTNGSIFLAGFFWLKSIIRNTTIAFTLLLPAVNLSKWWFKIGIWQLRCIFPENVLRVILDISTTKALNVYSETINGRASVSQVTRFLIFGFPLYWMGIKQPYPNLTIFKWSYSLILSIRAGHYDDSRGISLLSRTLAACNVCVLLYSGMITPLVSRYYEYLTKNVSPYFHPVEKSLDSFPSNSYDNLLIRTSWYDVLFESIVWPALGSIIGGKLFDAVIWMQRKRGFNWVPLCSPNDCRMVFNFFGCGLVAVTKQLINMWASYLRAKELRELQKSIEENTSKESY